MTQLISPVVFILLLFAALISNFVLKKNIEWLFIEKLKFQSIFMLLAHHLKHIQNSLVIS